MAYLATSQYIYNHDTGTFTATASIYTNPIPNPQFLPVSVTYYFPDSNSLRYIITIGPPIKNYIYTLDIILLDPSLGTSKGIITSSPVNFDIQTPYGMTGSGFSKATDEVILNCTYNVIRLYDNVPFSPDSYVNGDTYEITMKDLVQGSIDLKELRVVATRKNQTTIVSAINNNINNLRIPYINMTVQTTLNNLDVGESIFIVGDNKKYNHHKPLRSKCGDYYTSKAKITKFTVYMPFMVSVVRGKGKNLHDKILYLYNKYQIENPFITGASFPAFYDNIITYGMVKYILSRILYGHFDINCLLRQYNKKFIKELKNSRFCHFIQFFNLNNYNNFFIKFKK